MSDRVFSSLDSSAEFSLYSTTSEASSVRSISNSTVGSVSNSTASSASNSIFIFSFDSTADSISNFTAGSVSNSSVGSASNSSASSGFNSSSVSVSSDNDINLYISGPYNMSNDESHSPSNLSVSIDDVPSQLRELSANVTQMEAELDSINRYCEEVVAQMGNGNPPTSTSTPTIVRGNRRRSDVSPVEVIDLSHLEFIPPLRSARNRAPDAVIDLCTPDGPRSRPLNLTSEDSFSGPSRRRRTFAQSTGTPGVVDVDDVSPPKRIQRDLELSQKEDSYKCPVCMDSVTKREPVSTKCGHVFCRECIQSAISSTHKCPMCNKKLTARQYFRIYL